MVLLSERIIFDRYSVHAYLFAHVLDGRLEASSRGVLDQLQLLLVLVIALAAGGLLLLLLNAGHVEPRAVERDRFTCCFHDCGRNDGVALEDLGSAFSLIVLVRRLAYLLALQRKVHCILVEYTRQMGRG